MKLPPLNTRPRTILMTLLSEPATVYQGIERHGLLGTTEGAIRNIYERLALDGCLLQIGMVYTVSLKARLALAPRIEKEEGVPTAPAFRGNWNGPALSAATARRSGAAFGTPWVRS